LSIKKLADSAIIEVKSMKGGAKRLKFYIYNYLEVDN